MTRAETQAAAEKIVKAWPARDLPRLALALLRALWYAMPSSHDTAWLEWLQKVRAQAE